jgi:hypothetical protein
MSKRTEDLYDLLHGVIGWDQHDLSSIMVRAIGREYPQRRAEFLRPCHNALIVAYESQK